MELGQPLAIPGVDGDREGDVQLRPLQDGGGDGVTREAYDLLVLGETVGWDGALLDPRALPRNLEDLVDDALEVGDV